MKRRSLLSLAAGSTALTSLALGDFVSNLDKKRLPALDTTFRKFLADTVELRKGMIRIGPDADENNRIAQKMEPIATAAFLKGAENGDRRHQFYYGRLFQELHWLTKNEAYARQSERWFTAADKQNHPGAA